MREKRKLLALIFVVGVLISGIGAGIGLMEFFSLDYVGERIVGETEMATMEGEEELHICLRERTSDSIWAMEPVI